MTEPERLAAFIASQRPSWSSIQVGQPTPLNGAGNARRAWSHDVSWRDDHGVAGKQSVVMLVQSSAGQVEGDLGEEFDLLNSLFRNGIRVAEPLWCDTSGEVFDGPFLATAQVAGTADTRPLRQRPLDRAFRSVVLDLARLVADLHQLDPSRTPLASYQRTTAGCAIAALDRVEEQFRRVRLQRWPALTYALAWLRRQPPTAARLSVIHGDLRVGNFLYDRSRVTALLDWELAHIGDPVEDLGWLYRSLWSPEDFVPLQEFLDAYHAAGGIETTAGHARWYLMFAAVRHCVISLTGAAAFMQGRTNNINLADRAATVHPWMHEFMTMLLES